MGGGNGPTHFNAVQKDLLGWLDYGVSPPSPTSSRAAATRSIRSRRPGPTRRRSGSRRPLGDWLYVEFRRPVGFDSYISTNASVMNGVLVHYFDGGPNGVYLLDMTPTTTSWSDPALPVGTTFQDVAGNGEHHAHRGERNECDRQRHRRRRLLRPAGADRDDHSGTAAGRAGDDSDVHRIRAEQWHRLRRLGLRPSGDSAAGLDGRRWARRPSRSPEGATGRRRFRSRRAATAGAGPYGLSLSTSESGLSGSAAGELHRAWKWRPAGGGASPTASIAPMTRQPWAMAGHPCRAASRSSRARRATRWPKVLHMAVRPELQGRRPDGEHDVRFDEQQCSRRASASSSTTLSAGNYYLCYRQIGGSSVLRIAKVVNGVETVLKSATVRQSRSGLALHAVLPGERGHADAPARRGDQGHRGGSGFHRLRQRGLRQWVEARGRNLSPRRRLQRDRRVVLRRTPGGPRAPGRAVLDTYRRPCRLLAATSPMRAFGLRPAPCRTK